MTWGARGRYGAMHLWVRGVLLSVGVGRPLLLDGAPEVALLAVAG